MTFDLDLWPTDLNINRGHLLVKDYLPTKFEASGAKRSGVIRCTRWSRLAWPLTLTFDLLTWISIGIIYSSRTIYLLSLKVLGKAFLSYQLHKVKGYRHTDRPTDRHTDRNVQSNMPLLFQRGAQKWNEKERIFMNLAIDPKGQGDLQGHMIFNMTYKLYGLSRSLWPICDSIKRIIREISAIKSLMTSCLLDRMWHKSVFNEIKVIIILPLQKQVWSRSDSK